MSGFTLVTHSVRSMDYIFRWIGKKILMLWFSNAHPVLDLVLSSILTLRAVDTFTCEIKSENQPQVLTGMRTNNEKQFYILYRYIFGRTEHVLS